jgi:hypothetical protein
MVSLKESPGGLGRGRFEQELQAQVLGASSEKEHLAILKKSSRRRNRRSGFAEETAKSRQPLDLKESCAWFKP